MQTQSFVRLVITSSSLLRAAARLPDSLIFQSDSHDGVQPVVRFVALRNKPANKLA